jgi:hypothetical protein
VRLGWFTAALHAVAVLKYKYKGNFMSGQPSTRPKVPEGKCRFLTTTQMEANEKGYVGYKLTWEEFQKEVPYQTPKRP